MKNVEDNDFYQNRITDMKKSIIVKYIDLQLKTEDQIKESVRKRGESKKMEEKREIKEGKDTKRKEHVTKNMQPQQPIKVLILAYPR